jgi:hypothetical protein
MLAGAELEPGWRMSRRYCGETEVSWGEGRETGSSAWDEYTPWEGLGYCEPIRLRNSGLGKGRSSVEDTRMAMNDESRGKPNESH